MRDVENRARHSVHVMKVQASDAKPGECRGKQRNIKGQREVQRTVAAVLAQSHDVAAGGFEQQHVGVRGNDRGEVVDVAANAATPAVDDEDKRGRWRRGDRFEDVETFHNHMQAQRNVNTIG